MDWSKIIDVLNQPRLVIGIAVSTGVIIFLPSQGLQQLGLVQWRANSLPYIGVAFIASTVYCLIYVVNQGIAWVANERSQRSAKQAREKQLQELTRDEKAILRQFIEHGNRTCRLDINSGVVNGLVNKRIIYLAGSIATSGFADANYYGRIYGCDYNMEPWAWEYLNEHKDLLTHKEAAQQE